MIERSRTTLAAAFAIAIAGCTGTIGDGAVESTALGPSAGPSDPGRGAVDDPGATPGTVTAPLVLTPEQATSYLAKLAPPIVGRVLSASERASLARDAGQAIEPIVRAWTKEEGFVETARALIELKLSVSGSRDGIDFGLPGNLAARLAREDLPWSQLVTDDACWSRQGTKIACDSGAPYAAGVLTTRAYLASRASRFNLTRASTMMKAFACREYPQEDSLQPRIGKEKLIPMFRAATAAEQTDERARSGFGNGDGCYMCHGQFSVHAQLFVKFDSTGKWQKDATGVQDDKGELGRSTGTLMASHFVDPIEAASEASQFFGKPVSDLAAAGKILAQSPVFVECAARNVVEYSLGLTKPPPMTPVLLAKLASDARAAAGGGDPPLSAIVIATFSHPDVQRSIVQMLTGGTP
jgi:hypothetical protein